MMGGHEHLQMTLDEFEEIFIPTPNQFLSYPDESWRGCIFDIGGPELDYVREIADTYPEHVFTLMTNDFGGICVGDGYHLINRLGYIITVVPIGENQSLYACDELDYELTI